VVGDARGGNDVFSHSGAARFIAWLDNGVGTGWFHRDGQVERGATKIGQILQFWRLFDSLCLDSLPPVAISPVHSGAGFLAPLVFALGPLPKFGKGSREKYP